MEEQPQTQMSDKHGPNPNMIAFAVVILIIIIGGVWYYSGRTAGDDAMEKDDVMMEEKDGDMMMDKDIMMEMQESDVSEDTMMKMTDDAMMNAMDTMTFRFVGELQDVTDAKEVGGVMTNGKATGVVKSTFEDGVYSMTASFENLPEPQGTNFYEGWIVRKSPFDVISTGRLKKVDGVYVNTYTSGQDLTDHSFYVVTIEPDDGDPAPAEHILEGTMFGK